MMLVASYVPLTTEHLKTLERLSVDDAVAVVNPPKTVTSAQWHTVHITLLEPANGK